MFYRLAGFQYEIDGGLVARIQSELEPYGIQLTRLPEQLITEESYLSIDVSPTRYIDGLQSTADPESMRLGFAIIIPQGSGSDYSPILYSGVGHSFFIELEHWSLLDDQNVLDYASSVASGLTLYALGNCSDAEIYFRETLSNLEQFVTPTYSQTVENVINFYKATCALGSHNYDYAISIYENIVESGGLPREYASAVNLSWLYLQVERPDDAFRLIDDVVASMLANPRYVNFFVIAHVKRSQLYALAFRFDEAIADMDAAIAHDPDNPYLYVERGQRILLLYQWDRALADYNHAIELDPNYADAYYYRGVLYASVPEGFDARAEAIADFQRYLELAPNGAHAEDAQRHLTQIQSQLDSLDATPESTAMP